MRHLTAEEKPVPIQRVFQRTLDDCAICCVAMVTGLSYETVVSEIPLPQLIEGLKSKTLQDRHDKLKSKIAEFFAKHGFAVLIGSQGRVPGCRYIANVIIRHPVTNERSDLEHNIVIDEKGNIFDPSPDGKPPYRVSLLREIVFIGN